MRLLYAVQGVGWAEQGRDLWAAAVAASPTRKFVVLLIAGALVATGTTLLRFLKGGHGGELVQAIQSGDGEMPPARTLGRAVLSVIVVGLGAAVGREGALKQTGAVIAWRTAHRFGLSARQRRVLTACGAGAGMAAAYNIPLAGAVFAMEVLLGSVTWEVAVPALTCSIVATSISWTLLPMRMTYATPPYALSPNLLAWAAVVGPLIGLSTVGYVRLIGWADLHKPRSAAARLVAPLVVFPCLALGAVWLPELIGNGKDVVQVAFDGGGRDPRMSFAGALVGIAVLRALATALCLRAGTPGGLFTPTMTCGALLGAGAGRLWARVFPHDPPGGYAVVGSAAMLAAATGGPVSAVMAVLELGQHITGLVAPILLAVAGACLVMHLTGSPSVYTLRLARAEGTDRAPARSGSAPEGKAP
jgi:H+/Cl- antiporter ClcA